MTGANMGELVLAQAWTGLRRHALVALGAVANIAVSLAILGGFFLVATNIEHLARGLANEATISVYLTDQADGPALQRQLQQDPRVQEVKYVSKDQALEEYAASVSIPYKDLKRSISNPLPNLLRIRVREAADVPVVAQDVRKLPGVKKVRYQREVAEKLRRIARGTRLVGIVVGGVMTLAALLLVSTTIQLAIHSRRREIRIMQLVGATNAFIRAPFLIEGAIEGLAGGLLAALLLGAAYSYAYASVTAALPFLNLLAGGRFLLLSSLGVVACGVCFGLLGSLWGTRHYLRLI